MHDRARAHNGRAWHPTREEMTSSALQSVSVDSIREITMKRSALIKTFGGAALALALGAPAIAQNSGTATTPQSGRVTTPGQTSQRATPLTPCDPNAPGVAGVTGTPAGGTTPTVGSGIA